MSNDGTIDDKVPRGLRGLNKKHTLFGGAVPSKPLSVTVSSELQQLEQEAKSIEQWWSQPRWKYTKRNYTGMSSVAYGVHLNYNACCDS
jgi:Isocitrate lyase family